MIYINTGIMRKDLIMSEVRFSTSSSGTKNDKKDGKKAGKTGYFTVTMLLSVPKSLDTKLGFPSSRSHSPSTISLYS